MKLCIFHLNSKNFNPIMGIFFQVTLKHNSSMNILIKWLSILMLCITSANSGGSMYEENYFDTGLLLVEPEDSKVLYWESSEYLVKQDSLGLLTKYKIKLNNGN